MTCHSYSMSIQRKKEKNIPEQLLSDILIPHFVDVSNLIRPKNLTPNNKLTRGDFLFDVAECDAMMLQWSYK